jgi:hypothetical protein
MILANFFPFLISLSAPGRLIRSLRFTVTNQEIRNEGESGRLRDYARLQI